MPFREGMNSNMDQPENDNRLESNEIKYAAMDFESSAETLANKVEALGKNKNPEIRKKSALIKRRIKLTARLTLALFAINNTVYLANDFASKIRSDRMQHNTTRWSVNMEKNTDGTVEYKHEDPETTQILDYISGKSEIPGNAKRFMEISQIKMIRGFVNNESLRLGQLRKNQSDNSDLDTMSESELSNEYDSQLQSLISLTSPNEKKSDVAFVKGTLKDQLPTKYYYNPELYRALWIMEQKCGNPKIRFSEGATGISRSAYFKETNTIYIVYQGTGTLQTVAIDKFISELSHARQFDQEWFQTNIEDYVDIQIVKSRAGVSGESFSDAYDKTLYDLPGTNEYEAHKIIEPELKREFSDILKESDQKHDYHK